MAFITVNLIGNLTRDPELRVTPKGTAIAQFGIAANKKWKDENGQAREKVCFLDVEAWGKTAENLVKYFTKGNPIYLCGSLELDTWDDKTTGAKRSKHKLVVERFEFIGGREGRETGSQSESANEQAPAPRTRPAQSGLPGVPQPQHRDDEDVPF